MNMYRLFRPLLWTLDAERAHDLALAALGRAGASPTVLRRLQRTYAVDTPSLATKLWGLSFPNCIGLAAGMDKNGRALPGMAALGFGFLEVGTVTPRPQAGNPKPRMWRLREDEALINRLGFNNAGAQAVAERLATEAPRLPVPLGINIGKNADTPLERSLDDYNACLEMLHPWADYVVVNVSSPNTPGLRSLQHAAALDELLAALRETIDSIPATACTGTAAEAAPTDGPPGESRPNNPPNDLRASAGLSNGAKDGPPNGSPANEDPPNDRRDRPLPLLVKVAPDLTASDLDDIAEACVRRRIDGLIATNTTIRRDGLLDARAKETGGLSGAPLTATSNRIVAALHRRLGRQIPIVGVGGIMNAIDAYDKIKAGASLVQVLTGFVYGGPTFPRDLALGLEGLLQRDGFENVRQAVGVEANAYSEPEA